MKNKCFKRRGVGGWFVRSILLDVIVPLLFPVAGPHHSQPLALRNLGQRHLRGNRIAKPQVGGTLTSRGPRCRQVEPFVGKNEILPHAVTLVVTQAKSAL